MELHDHLKQRFLDDIFTKKRKLARATVQPVAYGQDHEVEIRLNIRCGRATGREHSTDTSNCFLTVGDDLKPRALLRHPMSPIVC